LQYASVNAAKNEITNDGLRGIECVDWPCLEGLSLNDNKLDHLGMEILVKTNFSATLRKLFLGNIGMTQEGTG
jgi:hypothetical protein